MDSGTTFGVQANFLNESLEGTGMKTRSSHSYFSLAIALLFAAWTPAPATAASPREAAANALALQGKLFCHRNLRAQSWVPQYPYAANQPVWHEADQDLTDMSLCGARFNGYASFMETFGPATVGQGLNGLPALEMRGSTGFFGLSTFGSGAPSPAGLTGPRWGWRFYTWSSGESDRCEQSKYTQFKVYWTASGGTCSIGGSSGVMWGAGGASVSGINLCKERGKWMRWEVYYNGSYLGGVSSVDIYIKNITDGGPEYSGHATSGLWAAGPTPSFQIMDFFHWYRDARNDENGNPIVGTCTNRFMYLLVAKGLGATERIPAAVEVEGTAPAPSPSPDTVSPAVNITSPTNGSVVKISAN
jgi:hypothetical protein